MRVEREIAGFALPFAAGVLITAYAEKSFCTDSQAVSYIALTAAVIVLPFLHFRERICCRGRWRDFAIWLSIGLVAFGLGALSAATGISLSLDWPLSQLEFLAGRFGNGLQQTIDAMPFQDQDTGALIKALLTGNRDSLSPDVTESFRASGASHILALSGLHLGLIYLLFLKLLGILGNSIWARRCRSCLLILLCGFYTSATGAGASIVRAFLRSRQTERAAHEPCSNIVRRLAAAAYCLSLIDSFSELSAFICCHGRNSLRIPLAERILA